MRFLILAVALGAVRAQSLQILPSPPSANGIASFRIMLVSPTGKEPVGLQWKLWLPEGVTIAPADIVAGSAAESAQKLLTCSPVRNQKETEKGSVIACILAGGQKVIANGPIAVAKCKTQKQEATVRVSEI